MEISVIGMASNLILLIYIYISKYKSMLKARCMNLTVEIGDAMKFSHACEK